jgi:hypothetical protein
MIAAFDSVLDRRHGTLSRTRLLIASIPRLLIDAAVQRLWTLGSHPSFSGRRPSDLGVVRPPNMGKAEWFHPESSDVD